MEEAGLAIRCIWEKSTREEPKTLRFVEKILTASETEGTTRESEKSLFLQSTLTKENRFTYFSGKIRVENHRKMAFPHSRLARHHQHQARKK